MENQTIQTELCKKTTQALDALRMALKSGKSLDEDSACHIIRSCVDELEANLSQAQNVHVMSSVRALLMGISAFLEYGHHHIQGSGYSRLLGRLVQIYASGMKLQQESGYITSANDYAYLIGVISRANPSDDYAQAIDQLMHYMNELYHHRKKGWLNIYQYLASIPDEHDDMHLIREKRKHNIQQWIEEGVNNLFQLYEDHTVSLERDITALIQLDQSLLSWSYELQQKASEKVISIDVAKQQQSLKKLEAERDSLYENLTNNRRLIKLLEENIKEFGDKLFEVRRAYLVKPTS